jgi:hypothetical protein
MDFKIEFVISLFVYLLLKIFIIENIRRKIIIKSKYIKENSIKKISFLPPYLWDF